MSPEAQRIAIAEECGLNDVAPWAYATGSFLRGALVGRLPNGNLIYVPDYLNDLNAMHEAELGLTDDEHYAFRDALRFVATNDPHTDPHRVSYSATAAHRAEAFLRVKWKWVEPAPIPAVELNQPATK